MATFAKGAAVKLRGVIPEGTVEALRMLEDGTIQCLFQWVDANGSTHQRWMDEDELEAA
jgi:hypothetical protein